jgi:hypothetical protein
MPIAPSASTIPTRPIATAAAAITAPCRRSRTTGAPSASRRAAVHVEITTTRTMRPAGAASTSAIQ